VSANPTRVDFDARRGPGTPWFPIFHRHVPALALRRREVRWFARLDVEFLYVAGSQLRAVGWNAAGPSRSLTALPEKSPKVVCGSVGRPLDVKRSRMLPFPSSGVNWRLEHGRGT
jgi:hypothetical protein